MTGPPVGVEPEDAPDAALAAPPRLACPACGVDVPASHPYSWCSACGVPLPDTVRAHLSNPYTGRSMSPSFSTLRENSVPDLAAVREAVEKTMAPPPASRMALVLTASIALFAIAQAVGGESPAGIVLLVVVLFVHESGHYLAMRAFGYRNVRMFFIPFLGAAVSSPSTNVAAWKQGVVLLAGPVPGIAAGLALAIAALATSSSLWREAASVALLLNAFNLLPLGPLDGGQLLRLTIFGRWRWAELAFLVVTCLALAAFAAWSGAWLLALFALVLAASARHRHRELSAAARLRVDHPAMSPDLLAMTDSEERMLYHRALEVLPPQINKTAFHVAGVMRALLEALRPPPSILASAALLVVWALSGLLAMVAAAALVYTPPGDWAEWACPNIPVTARFPAEPLAETKTVDGRRNDICAAGAIGFGYASVTRDDVGRALDQAARVEMWPMLVSPPAVERMIDGRFTVDVPLPDATRVRFIFDGPVVYRVSVLTTDEATARAFLDSVRLDGRR